MIFPLSCLKAKSLKLSTSLTTFTRHSCVIFQIRYGLTIWFRDHSLTLHQLSNLWMYGLIGCNQNRNNTKHEPCLIPRSCSVPSSCLIARLRISGASRYRWIYKKYWDFYVTNSSDGDFISTVYTRATKGQAGNVRNRIISGWNRIAGPLSRSFVYGHLLIIMYECFIWIISNGFQ